LVAAKKNSEVEWIGFKLEWSEENSAAKVGENIKSIEKTT
jgi:hypothetical protein